MLAESVPPLVLSLPELESPSLPPARRLRLAADSPLSEASTITWYVSRVSRSRAKFSGNLSVMLPVAASIEKTSRCETQLKMYATVPFSPPSGSVAWALKTTVPLAAPSETSAVALPFSPLSKVGALSFMSPTTMESETVPTARPRASMPVTING